MISVASNFQYSVNIGYDLNNNEKLRDFIPTKSALDLLRDILQSTKDTSNERARVLIGSYGKGKSHIVLTILSMLMKKNRSLFVKTMPKIEEDPALLQLVNNYYDSDNKILPVVITGSNTSLTQAFLLALERTLSDNNLMDIMPETNYKAACNVISRWQTEFPDTYQAFVSSIDSNPDVFIERLNAFDISAYELFESIYPQLTSGSVFNPFLGFDVVELYENAAIGLKKKGYSGIYVIYDEFSKYLEANIIKASVSDTKMLQDFAEKCNRSGNLQMHLMLISHKEISNYIDKLPKQKVDGWKGVSERFKHIHLSNNFGQTYEIISSVIQKEPTAWKKFIANNGSSFTLLKDKYENHTLFNNLADSLDLVIYGCYPLHPISTFILPRLSERVAQNERTLFTFLSAEGSTTLRSFLAHESDSNFQLLTPDLIYDYFELLFKKEDYASYIHTNYVLTNKILNQISENILQCKIVKTISLIYMLEQFEALKPVVDEIMNIYSTEYEPETIRAAIDDLVNKEYVIYLKRSNGFLKLKETSGVDIKKKINDTVETGTGFTSVKNALNRLNFDSYIYPSRYNDSREMTRYFAFRFVDSSEINKEVDWSVKRENIKADGVIYGVIVHADDNIQEISKELIKTSKNAKSCVFVLPKRFLEIEESVKELTAVSSLRDSVIDDPILFDEYDLIYDDLNEVIKNYINRFTHPEENASSYIYCGKKELIKRKASLTELLSSICDNLYSKTPIINNEALNRDDITSVSSNSRAKIVSALLRTELEPNLGLSGTGQEVSIMRSTLIRTGLLIESEGIFDINLHPQDELVDNMMSTIETFVLKAKKVERVSFEELYSMLMSEEYGIGLRKGLIPIYIAATIYSFRNQVIICSQNGQETITSDLIAQINANPGAYTLSYIDWDLSKEKYIEKLAKIFSESIVDAEKKTNSYAYIANAMHRWYLSLPKYAKEAKELPNGKRINKEYVEIIRAIKQSVSDYDLVFKQIPKACNSIKEVDDSIANKVGKAKKCYDGLLTELTNSLIGQTRILFSSKESGISNKASLFSIITDWCESLDKLVFEQLFSDGTDKCLALFKSITNDELDFICKLARLVAGLRIEDWDSLTQKIFYNNLKEYKSSAESFHSQAIISDGNITSSYQISFADNTGDVITKRFDRVDVSARGKLLENQINAALASMGHSISENEKRQILVEILKNIC